MTPSLPVVRDRVGRTEDEFDDLARRCGPRLLSLARLLTRDDATAQDLLQASLAVVWAKRRDVDDPQAVEAFARRVMVRKATAWYSRRWNGEVSTSSIPDSARPEVDVAARADVLRALARLGRRERAVLALRYFEDLSEADTAAALGCSTTAVKAATRRGLDRLRAMTWEGYTS